MVLLNDPFWDHVEVLNDGGFKCKFCGQSFALTTSISRIKWHFSAEKGHGVAICGSVPKRLQEEALEAMRGGNKRRKGNAGTSNINVAAISTSPPEQNNEVENLGGDIGSLEQRQDRRVEQRVGEDRPSLPTEVGEHLENLAGDQVIMHTDRSNSPDKHEADALEIRRDALQATDQIGQLDIENTDWTAIADRAAVASISQFLEVDVENGVRGCVPPVAGASSSAPHPCNISHQTRGDALPTGPTKLVGEAFEKNRNAIWSWLMNDEVSLVGIYGMGGVGKTTMMKHIFNQLPSTFGHVYWITVSQDFSIYRLQNLIARRIGLDLSNEDEELYRAAKLSEKLMEKQRWVLILDDLWNPFDLEVVGIPIQLKGCNLILTTRSQRVCRQLVCQKMIKVEPLSDVEAWTLFIEMLGHDNALSPEVEKIAKSITRECDGLPLGITTMARTMRGVLDISDWRNALKELKESEIRKDDMEPEVFKILKFSYNHLKDSALQQCFLHCALFPEDFVIGRQILLYFLIDQGIIKGMQSLQTQFDKGHVMLNKLEDVCLLESCGIDDRSVKMHDLVRDMALQILEENSQVMVKAGKRLKELPDVEEWNMNLLTVSLMYNEIFEIPQSHAPRCPNLSTLLLCHNRELQFIADSFFKQFQRLKVLDLFDTRIEVLPDFVSDLVSLRALLLRDCWKLRRIPSLRKLKGLRRLDLIGTELENFPEDMELLSNLNYLGVGGFGLKEFPTGILPQLSHLQVFIQQLRWQRDQECRLGWVKGKEVACLKKLEILHCYFEHLSDLEEYLQFRDETQSLSSYALYAGRWGPYVHDNVEDKGCINKTVGLCDLIIRRDRDFQVMFPNDMKELKMHGGDDATSLCDILSSIKHAVELEEIDISCCDGMESLLSSSWFCFAPLEPPSSHALFPCLKKLKCDGCLNMKKLFPSVLLPNLVNLEEINVKSCDNLEEIIATTDEVRDMDEECSSRRIITEFSLPKLRYLKLEYLPELKSICTAKLKCNSLQEISVFDCPKLKRLPFSLPLENGRPTPPPSLREINMDDKTWELVEWEPPNAKDVLLPFRQGTVLLVLNNGICTTISVRHPNESLA